MSKSHRTGGILCCTIDQTPPPGTLELLMEELVWWTGVWILPLYPPRMLFRFTAGREDSLAATCNQQPPVKLSPPNILFIYCISMYFLKFWIIFYFTATGTRRHSSHLYCSDCLSSDTASSNTAVSWSTSAIHVYSTTTCCPTVPSSSTT